MVRYTKSKRKGSKRKGSKRKKGKKTKTLLTPKSAATTIQRKVRENQKKNTLQTITHQSNTKKIIFYTYRPKRNQI